MELNLEPQQGGTQPAAPQTAVDFWDLGGAGGGGDGETVAQDYQYSEIVNIRPSDSGSNNAKGIILAVLLLGVLGYAGYYIYTSDKDPLDQIMSMIGLSDGSSSTTTTTDPTTGTENTSDADTDVEPELMADPDLEAERAAKVAGNPYWSLPNKIAGFNDDITRDWSPDEEEALRAGLAHPYTYQRWKTVRDIRNLRLRGSEALLWEALAERKFWTRMWALVGLGEFNIEVSLQVVEETIGDARSELVADFFERFIERNNAGQRYVMRQALKLSDEKTRLNILKALDRGKDELRDVYMAAATLDPGPRIQRWVQKALRRRPIPAADYDRYVAAVKSGNLVSMIDSDGSNTISDSALLPTTSGSEYDDLEGFEDYGEVEFFDGESATTNTEDDEYDDYEVDENF